MRHWASDPACQHSRRQIADHMIGLPSIVVRLRLLAVFIVLFCLVGPQATAEEPLHQQIDRLMAQLHFGPEVPLASDAEFMRRVYLDLAGTIPSADEVRQFIDDPSSEKRTQLVDRLLASPAYARHMAGVFDVMLMERRADKYIKGDQWQAYLLAAFQQNKPYNELAREILAADPDDEQLRAASKFYVEREVEPNLVTREVSRMFFGMDIQCAQCHNHPLIDDYLQSEYYGLYAFVSRSSLFQPDTKKPAVLAEKADGATNFKSVFTEEEGTTLPRLPGGAEIDEPVFAKGDEYLVKPDPKNKNVRPVPKYSRRAQLAARATDGGNRAFNRNIVNRLWAHMLGRGLVHPVDLHHVDNPPIHPELLDLLADQFVAMKFDIKALLRELALSRTYQESFRLPDDLPPHTAAAREKLAALQAELPQREQAIEQSKQSLAAAAKQLSAAQQAAAPLTEQWTKAAEALAAAQKAADDAANALGEAQTQLADKQQVAGLLSEAVAKAQDAAAKLPGDEQLAKVVQTLTTKQQQFSTATVELEKTLAERQPASNAAAQELAAAQSAADAATSALSEPKQLVDACRNQLLAAQANLERHQVAAAHVEEQTKIAESTVAFGDKLAALSELRSAVAKLETEQTDPAQADAAELAAPSDDSLSAAPAKLADAEQQVETAREALAEQWSNQFALAQLQPLSPEQLAWSILRATGQFDRQRAAEQAALDKKSPLPPDQQNDPAKLAARAQQVEQAAYDKLKPTVARFVALFGAAAGAPQDNFFATVDQALFFANGGEVRGWLTPAGGNLTGRLVKLGEPAAIAEELYLSILTRRPTDEETADVQSYLSSRPDDKSAAVQEVAWALLTSSEFRFQH